MHKDIKIFVGEIFPDYELMDTGVGEKLERFGAFTFVRPLENAFWKKSLDQKIWDKADGRFLTSKEKGGNKGGWEMKNKKMPKDWIMTWRDLKFKASPTPFRHLSFFPEQASHWEFIYEKVSSAKKPVKFLNLFGYTGVASLVALSTGAEVTHVDASKQSVELAKENQKLSGLEDKPMRVIVDDVMKFLEREVKRGNKYDAVIMDPPKHGRGPKSEIWKLDEKLPKLLDLVSRVLSSEPLFVILTSYSTDSSALSLGYTLENALKEKGGSIESGEMCIKETSTRKMISLAHTAVWQK